MKPLSADFDLSDIVGRQLNQIGVGRWDVQFAFDCTRVIQSMGKITVTSAAETVIAFDGEWIDISPISDVVGLEVVAWNKVDDYSFSITMDEGHVITIHTSDSPYEELIIHPEMRIL